MSWSPRRWLAPMSSARPRRCASCAPRGLARHARCRAKSAYVRWIVSPLSSPSGDPPASTAEPSVHCKLVVYQVPNPKVPHHYAKMVSLCLGSVAICEHHRAQMLSE